MLDRLTVEDFEPLVGERFSFAFDDGEIAVELTEASGAGVPGPGATRAPFSIAFRGPERPVLSQGSVRVSHAGLGEFDLFIVPIESGPDGTLYEAVFS